MELSQQFVRSFDILLEIDGEAFQAITYKVHSTVNQQQIILEQANYCQIFRYYVTILTFVKRSIIGYIYIFVRFSVI